MLKGKDKVKSDVETETRDGHPFDSERFKSQIEFILEIDKLKTVLRRTTLLDRSRQENSAEHSWHIALILLVLSEYADEDNLDLFQVIKLLIWSKSMPMILTAMMKLAARLKKCVNPKPLIEFSTSYRRIRPIPFEPYGMNTRLKIHLNQNLPMRWIGCSRFYTIILPAGTPGKSMVSGKARLLRECSRSMTAPTSYGIMSPASSMTRLRKVIYRSNQIYLKSTCKWVRYR
jgi:hypothetical protein